MELKNIAILGAGGNVGTVIVKELLKDGASFTITAITRQTSSYTPPVNSGIVHKTVDYASFDSLKGAFTGQDAIVNCVTGGATQWEPSKLIIDAAVAANVKFFFADEYVGDIMREQFKRLPEAFVGAKVRVREYLEALGNEGKIGWTALNGGPFFDMWLMKGPAGFDVKNRRARIYGTGLNSMCWTPLPTIGLAAANMLRNPDRVMNRAIFICPFRNGELTQQVLLTTLEAVVGAKFEVTNAGIVKINKNARIALERGEAMKAMKGLTLSNQFYEEDSGSDSYHLVENETVGVEMMTVEEAVRQAIGIYGEDHKIVEGMFYVEACEV